MHGETQELNPPVSVGRSYREWWFVVLAVITAVLVVGGPLLLIARPDLGIPTLIAAGACAFLTCGAAAVIATGKCSVQMTPSGFLVHDRRGEREILDEQVICVSLHSQSNFVNGELKSSTRTFDVWAEGDSGPERIKMVNRIPLSAADPLVPLISRIIEHLHDRAEEALEAGQTFEGEGWTVHPEELIVHRSRNSAAVRFSDLAAVDVFDNDLCVWRENQDEPALRIPIRSANVHVLTRLLRARLPEAAESAEAPLGNRLGRILFERKPGRGTFALVWILPVLSLMILIVTLIAAAVTRDLSPLFGGAILCVLFGLIWLLPFSQCVIFRCHEHGVYRKWLVWETRLRYNELDSFTYTAVRQFVKGVYSGTNFSLVFESRSSGKPRKLTYTKTIRNADEELDNLRDHVSRVIAGRLAEILARQGTASWTDGLRFLKDGLEYRAAGLLGRKAPMNIPYAEIHSYDIKQATFSLWTRGSKKPTVKESVHLANFFPGLMLLAQLWPARLPTASAGDVAATR